MGCSFNLNWKQFHFRFSLLYNLLNQNLMFLEEMYSEKETKKRKRKVVHKHKCSKDGLKVSKKSKNEIHLIEIKLFFLFWVLDSLVSFSFYFFVEISNIFIIYSVSVCASFWFLFLRFVIQILGFFVFCFFFLIRCEYFHQQNHMSWFTEP